MKKMILIALSIVAMLSAATAQNRVNLFYQGGNSLNDKKVLSSTDTIVRVGSHSDNLFFGEIFFDRRNIIGAYGSYGFQSGLTDQFQASKFRSWSTGLVSTASLNPVWGKLYVGYFQKNQIWEGFTSQFDYFKDSIKIRGLEVRTSILFAQDDFSFFPRIEVWGRMGVSCGKGNKPFLESYNFGLDIQAYRLDILPDYFLSPMIGVEKKELLALNMLTYKVGIALGSNFTPNPIAKVFIFVTHDNKYHSYTNNEGSVVMNIKEPVIGIGCVIAPLNLFW